MIFCLKAPYIESRRLFLFMPQEETKGRFGYVLDKNPKAKTPTQLSKAQGLREQLEWIKRQLEYASFAERFKLRYDLKKGEIYEIDWGLNVNAEFSSRHFGIVLADSGPFNPLVTVCPLKTNHSGCHPKSDVDLGIVPGVFSQNSALAVANQVRTVDKLRVFTKNCIGQRNVSKDDQVNFKSDGEHSIPRLENEKVDLIVGTYLRLVFGREQNTKL